MDNTQNLAFKPVMLKTPEGYAFFDYDEIVMFKADGRFSLLYTVHHYNSPPKESVTVYPLLKRNIVKAFFTEYTLSGKFVRSCTKLNHS